MRAPRRILALLAAGRRLWWFGDNGPQMEGQPFWPQKRTVRMMLRRGLLAWAPYQNETQHAAGICELVRPGLAETQGKEKGNEEETRQTRATAP